MKFDFWAGKRSREISVITRSFVAELVLEVRSTPTVERVLIYFCREKFAVVEIMNIDIQASSKIFIYNTM